MTSITDVLRRWWRSRPLCFLLNPRVFNDIFFSDGLDFDTYPLRQVYHDDTDSGVPLGHHDCGFRDSTPIPDCPRPQKLPRTSPTRGSQRFNESDLRRLRWPYLTTTVLLLWSNPITTFLVLRFCVYFSFCSSSSREKERGWNVRERIQEITDSGRPSIDGLGLGLGVEAFTPKVSRFG